MFFVSDINSTLRSGKIGQEFEKIDSIIGYVYGGKSRLDLIQRVYIENKFTKRQKDACELFLFEPSKQNAIRAIEITPKVWLFIKTYTDIHDEIVKTIDKVLASTKKKSYQKELLTYHKSLLDLLVVLQKFSSNSGIVKQIKIIMLERKLSKNIEE